MKVELAPARVTLGIATFFTVASQTQTFNQGLPKVPYVKAIDVWMVTCNVFVFGALVEYCVAQVSHNVLLINPAVESSAKKGANVLFSDECQ